MVMNKSLEAMSQIIHFMKYARYQPEMQRRETFEETVFRNQQFHLRHHPELADEINEAYEYVYQKKIVPSMRSMQFAGKPIDLTPSRIYNCCYLPVDAVEAFSEIMFLLLGGTGVGYSVQSMHISKLPEIKGLRLNPKTGLPRKRRYVISDSIEGWADAVKVLMEAYFYGKSEPNFDFADIRPKGARLVTSGGKAPGPEPLKDCLHNIKKVLDRKQPHEKLAPIEVHDICCYIADAVLAGGIRRAALISLFDFDDEEMLTAKHGNWWELNPQRGRANNSAVALRHKITYEAFKVFWKKVELSQSGEPGIIFSNDPNYGFNPCVEASLRPYSFCNLTDVNVAATLTQEELNQAVIMAARIGTLQASYTDFHYLREIWKENTEKDALIGVGLTGLAGKHTEHLDFKEAARLVKEENARMAEKLGINEAARCTVVKPSGTTSCVLGTSSGIHAWHAKHYIRNVRVGKNEAIYKYLMDSAPEMVEDEFFKPQTQAVIGFPIAAPEGAILRDDESALDFLERVKRFNVDWCLEGYRRGANSHNVSATVSIKADEWEAVGEWMWANRESFTGLSVLPYDGGTYVQAPFETCDEEKYLEKMSHIKSLDLASIIEEEDETDLTGELACAGGACEVNL